MISKLSFTGEPLAYIVNIAQRLGVPIGVVAAVVLAIASDRDKALVMISTLSERVVKA